VRLNEFLDHRGVLRSLDFDSVSFDPKRIFVVSDVPTGVTRGGHAHKTTTQLLVCLRGRISVEIYTSPKSLMSKEIRAGESVEVSPMNWDRQTFLTEGSVLLVLCSTEFSEKDYIRSWSEWKATL